MLLSSVNLIKSKNISNNNINSHQFSDFILGKIKEDQDRRDEKTVTAKFSSKQLKPKNTRDVFTFDIPRVPPKVDVEKKPSAPRDNEEEIYVSIETSDGYFMAVDAARHRVFLEDSVFPSHQTCSFKHRVFKADDNQRRLVVFQVLTNGHENTYLSTTEHKTLDVKKFDTMPNPKVPDERFYVAHYTSDGNILLQPHAHKGFYIHHLDQELNVRRLEINWRPPEEYFFEIVQKDEDEVEAIKATQELIKLEKLAQQRQLAAKKEKIQNVEIESPKTSLLLGCFGIKSRKVGKGADKKKGKR